MGLALAGSTCHCSSAVACDDLPRLSSWWNRLEVKRDLLGVVSWGLEGVSMKAGRVQGASKGCVPLVHVQVGRHVGGQTGGGGGASHGLHGEVVGGRGLLHAHVPEVEVLGAQRVCSEQGLCGWQVSSVAPWAGQRRRVHGCERRGHVHGCVGRVWGLVVGQTRVGVRVWSAGGGFGRAIGMQWEDEKANSNLKKDALGRPGERCGAGCTGGECSVCSGCSVVAIVSQQVAMVAGVVGRVRGSTIR